MAAVHPSSLIGAQAYAAQLRSQYSQEEARRAFSPDANPVSTTARERASSAPKDIGARNDGRLPRQASKTGSLEDAKRPNSVVNPTIGEIATKPNPPARPLYSAAHREAPNPNARLRITPPGSHLNIIV